MYRLLACRNFGEMNVSLISMKNMIFLLGNPPSKCPKCQNFRACGALRGSLIILRISESEIQMYRLLAFRKSVQMSMYRLLRGGAFIINWEVVYLVDGNRLMLTRRLGRAAGGAE